MTTVSASEFQKNFGYFKEIAQREPVMVTSNGRESVVLLSAAEYAELKKLRYAYRGEVTEEFKQDLTLFMEQHAAVLKVLPSERDAGGDDGKLRWWDVEKGQCMFVRPAHEGAVQALRRTTDGTKLASCGDDGAIMLWDLESGSHRQTLRRDRP